MLRTAEFPEDFASEVPDIDLRGRRDCYITGCKKIVEYTENRIVFDSGTVYVVLNGKGLSLMSYGDGYMCANGTIDNVCFKEDAR